jgi:predicted amidophosphoribosyltransferase
VTEKNPSRDDAATMPCPVCERPFEPFGRRRYCCDGCRRKAWARRHQSPVAPVVVPGPGWARRPVTVYECGHCGTRAPGVQRCEECGAFMARIGVGGYCPECDAPVAVADLIDVVPLPPPARREGGRR